MLPCLDSSSNIRFQLWRQIWKSNSMKFIDVEQVMRLTDWQVVSTKMPQASKRLSYVPMIVVTHIRCGSYLTLNNFENVDDKAACLPWFASCISCACCQRQSYVLLLIRNVLIQGIHMALSFPVVIGGIYILVITKNWHLNTWRTLYQADRGYWVIPRCHDEAPLDW